MQKRLNEELSTTRENDKKLQELVDNLRNPEDRIKQWAKEEAKTELAHNTDEEERLTKVQSLVTRMAAIFSSFDEVIKAQRQVMSAYK